MNFTDAVKRNLTTSAYAQFEGRASRSEFWWFYLGSILISVLVGFVDGFLFGTEGGILSLIAVLVLLIPGIATAVRRLHDTGRSG